MLEVVSPVLHTNEFPPLAVSVVPCPLQIDTPAGVIDGLGIGFTFTVLEADAEQPFPSVTVTV